MLSHLPSKHLISSNKQIYRCAFIFGFLPKDREKERFAGGRGGAGHLMDM